MRKLNQPYRYARRDRVRACAIFLTACLYTGCTGSESARSPVSVQHEYPESLEVVTRADWGWEEGEALLAEHEIERITIHHGGEAYREGRDTGEYLRSLQNWSRTEKQWMDIPYHYVIDLEGEIFEARPINYPGDTNTAYDPRGHALIEVVGNYETRELSHDQYESLTSLTAYLARTYDVDVSDVMGHKDFADTACPGENIYKFLRDGSLLADVRSKLERM